MLQTQEMLEIHFQEIIINSLYSRSYFHVLWRPGVIILVVRPLHDLVQGMLDLRRKINQ